LQEKYENDGVVIIGVGSSAAPDKLGRAQKLADAKHDVMRYTVAWDGNGATWQRFMVAAKQQALPMAFVIDRKGRLAYVGHPAAGMESALEGVVSGTLDLGHAIEHNRAQREAKSLLREFRGYLKQGKLPEAFEIGRRLVDHPGAQNAKILGEIAWTIVDPHADLSKRDVDLAFNAASRAVELTKHADPNQLDTLAWCYFLKGNRDQAVETERLALSLVPDGQTGLREALETSMKVFLDTHSRDASGE